MKAGKLDRQITLKTLVTTRNAVGEDVPDWVHFITLPAQVIEVRGREYFAAAAVQAEDVLRFKTRFYLGVTRTMRLIYENENYDILAVAEIGRRQGLEITAKVKKI